jgi:hypothetical protein
MDELPCTCVHACVHISVCGNPDLGPSIPARSTTAARCTPTVAQNSDRPPHPRLSFAFTSAPCVRSAFAIAACPLAAALWSGVALRVGCTRPHTAARVISEIGNTPMALVLAASACMRARSMLPWDGASTALAYVHIITHTSLRACTRE